MNADEILQAHLNQMTDCVMRQDFAAYLTGFSLPLHLVTATTNLTVTTEQELRLGFEEFGLMLKIQRVTDCIRLVSAAHKVDDQLICGTYATHLFSGGTRILPPVTSQTAMRHGADSGWRTVSITNGVAGRISSNAWVKESDSKGESA
jgi:hypothetical protein